MSSTSTSGWGRGSEDTEVIRGWHGYCLARRCPFIPSLYGLSRIPLASGGSMVLTGVLEQRGIVAHLERAGVRRAIRLQTRQSESGTCLKLLPGSDCWETRTPARDARVGRRRHVPPRATLMQAAGDFRALTILYSDMTGAAKRVTRDMKSEAGLAEWTSKIKAMQQQVDADEEAEQRSLEEEIAASRLARLHRSRVTGGRSRTHSLDLCK